MKTLKPKKLSPLCQSNCKICNSGYAELVHNFVTKGKTYREIQDYLKKEKKFEVSLGSISRHYQKFKEYKEIKLRERLTQKVKEETDELVNHQDHAIKLADLIYDRLLLQFENNRFGVEISDWEKIVKLYHQVLLGKGDGDPGKELKVIFEQAMNKYGGQQQQMRLKFGGDDAVAEQKEENKKEEH